ncbi:MAG TPA: ATP-binding protein [Anaerolineales bacterium]|nr:ATP-binding protein [Anaerolineales bacterium]
MQPTIPGRYLKLERLLKLSRDLSIDIPYQDMLQTIIEHICELTLSEAGSILLFEEETNLLKFIAAPSDQHEVLRRMRVPLENSVAGLAFTAKRPVVVQDASLEPHIYREADQILKMETQSVAAIPIIYRDHSLGVLEAINKRGGGHYSDEDLTILETLASLAGNVLFVHALLEQTQFAYQDLAELERMKSDFIAITSHELRTPLGLILGHASFLRETTQNDKQRQQLEVIVRNALRLSKILEDLSSINSDRAGASRLRRKNIPLQGLIRGISTNFEQQLEQKNIELLLNLPEKGLTVEADQEKLSIAIGNLLENAISFCIEGGQIAIQAEKLPGYVKVSVIDNGVGIPAKDLPHVFERFFQVESHRTRKHGGMGLGLSVAQVMVELHGGHIWAESEEGHGSTFSFLLPITSEEAAITHISDPSS